MARVRPLFTGQKTYRIRRLGDAARLLPGLGVILFLLPLLIRPADPSAAFLYVFGIWALLILCMAVMSRGLARYNLSEEAANLEAEYPPADPPQDGASAP